MLRSQNIGPHLQHVCQQRQHLHLSSQEVFLLNKRHFASPCCVGNSPVVKTYFNGVFSSQKSYLERGNWMIGTAERTGLFSGLWSKSLDPQWPQITTSNEAGLQLQNPKECPFRHVDDFPLLKAGFSDSMCVFLWRMPYKYISRSLGWEIIVKFLQHLISECLLNSVQNWKVPYVTNAGWWTAKTSAPLRLRLYSLSWCLIYLVSSYPFGCNGMILWRQKPRNKRETAIYTPCTYTVCYVCLGSHNFFLQHHSILTGH